MASFCEYHRHPSFLDSSHGNEIGWYTVAVEDIFQHIALKNPRKAVEIAVHAARQALKNAGGKRRIRTPRIIPIPKTGGILPLLPIFAGLSALGTLDGSAAGVSKVINDVKLGKQRLAEAVRHNRSMESIALGKNGKGLYLKAYKTGLGLYLNAKNTKKLLNSLPRRPLTDLDLTAYSIRMKIPHFRGIFMRNNLPADGPRKNEAAILI
ncbi:hypothetical protein NQ318_020408 [Aromia moschata]|uniref:Uncharacterized protein n=1 Tax=Aromia moschata TaxID=1265417 RepID=A0AAV8Y3S8_9CUCU|nr:hypothetical protein NQ318_020408 [Aromia moschata]